MTRTETCAEAETAVLNVTVLLSYCPNKERKWSVLVPVCSTLGTALSLPMRELPLLWRCPPGHERLKQLLPAAIR